MSSTQQGRRAWEIGVLLALAILLVAAIALNLANLEPLGESAPVAPAPTSGRPVETILPNSMVLAVLWSFAVVLFVVIVLLLLRRPKTTHRRLSSWWGLLPSVLGILLFVVLLASIPRSLSPSANETATTDGREANSVPDLPSLANGGPLEAVLLLVVFGTIGWIVYRTRWGAGLPSGRSVKTSDGPGAREAAADALRDTIRELEIGADVRTTILACFQRFCLLLRSRGLADQDAFTAREIESLAVRTFSVSRDASASLTTLFEEARYSVHPLAEVDRERAIESLGRIRAALEA